jgi:hypothetical protein
MPGMKGTVQIIVQKNDGTILECIDRKMDSFMDAFAYILAWIMTGNMVASGMKNVLGNSLGSWCMFVGADPAPAIAGNDAKGILVGSGVTPWQHNDVAIETQILHGSTTGKLQYGVEVPTNPVWVPASNKWTFKIERVFANVSGASITVNEIAYYSKNNDYQGPNGPIMIAREVISPVALPDSSTMRVTYSFELTA